jgi:hypothetical protein
MSRISGGGRSWMWSEELEVYDSGEIEMARGLG